MYLKSLVRFRSAQAIACSPILICSEVGIYKLPVYTMPLAQTYISNPPKPLGEPRREKLERTLLRTTLTPTEAMSASVLAKGFGIFLHLHLQHRRHAAAKAANGQGLAKPICFPSLRLFGLWQALQGLGGNLSETSLISGNAGLALSAKARNEQLFLRGSVLYLALSVYGRIGA